MSMIKIENLTFSYPTGSENVFENFNATIDTDWKLALTGRNGRGKTTLLKILLGGLEYRGRVVSSVQCDYFPYVVRDKSKSVSEIISEICPAVAEWEFVKELSGLGVGADALYMPFEYLSNGEQTKVLLAALFLNEGHYLMIDEPTNHLDAFAREQVAEYLSVKKGFILVSHDRDFLDRCVDHVMSIGRSEAELCGGSFSSWLNDSENRRKADREQTERLQKEIKRLKRSSVQSADWASKCEAQKKGNGPVDRGYIGHKAAKMMKHSKIIEERQQKLIEDKTSLLKNIQTAEKLKLSAVTYRSDRLAEFSQVQIIYDGVAVNRAVSFSINRGQRIALSGGNGCGKSSLIKALMGQNILYSGRITVSGDLKISFVPQDVSEICGGVRSLIKESGVEESLFMAVLNKMGVEENPLRKDMRELSEGQKKKIMIAKSICERAHLYIWDEPLNYIDIDCRIQIEKLLKEFCPTMIFIEHDRAFRNGIATDVVEIIRSR